jgi:type IV pilus assembly protein PilA
MKGLREKFRNKKGFTLVEILIVVAIIAILVAVSIPLVNTSLTKAREATDDANLRAAKAEATIMYMNYQMGVDGAVDIDGQWYDNVAGTFVANKPAGYNQSTTAAAVADANIEKPKTAALKVTIDEDSAEPITIVWATT